MAEQIPATQVERLNWVKQVDGAVAVSVTATGRTLALLFNPADAEALLDGLMGSLPQQVDEAPAIAISPDHPPLGVVEEVELTDHDDPPHAIEMHLRTGEDEGVQIRVSLREAIRWQRRLSALIATQLRGDRN